LLHMVEGEDISTFDEIDEHIEDYGLTFQFLTKIVGAHGFCIIPRDQLVYENYEDFDADNGDLWEEIDTDNDADKWWVCSDCGYENSIHDDDCANCDDDCDCNWDDEGSYDYDCPCCNLGGDIEDEIEIETTIEFEGKEEPMFDRFMKAFFDLLIEISSNSSCPHCNSETEADFGDDLEHELALLDEAEDCVSCEFGDMDECPGCNFNNLEWGETDASELEDDSEIEVWECTCGNVNPGDALICYRCDVDIIELDDPDQLTLEDM